MLFSILFDWNFCFQGDLCILFWFKSRNIQRYLLFFHLARLNFSMIDFILCLSIALVSLQPTLAYWSACQTNIESKQKHDSFCYRMSRCKAFTLFNTAYTSFNPNNRIVSNLHTLSIIVPLETASHCQWYSDWNDFA